MIFCEKYSDLIQDLLEDELDEHRTAQAESHILACQGCCERYETLRQAKEIYTPYLFDAEPPPDSWTNFQARLNSENEKARGEEVIAASWFRRRQRMFGFSFSPAAATLAAVLFVCGIGFVRLQTGSVEKDGDKYVAETEYSLSPTQSNETDEKPAINSPSQDAATDDIPESSDLLTESKSLKAKSNSLFGKKSFAETVKINQKTASLNERRKSASGLRLNKENRLSDLQAQNLEIEIIGQMEKVELLLRSFRNARSNETAEGFDIEYEKRQARKLLDRNALLKRRAENHGLSYAEELLSLVEPHLLEIANLETNPSTDRVLDIKDRVSSQNIIASLQAYSRDATQ
ncbi:MAG TPA: anti-sigma factor [Pyrinomonadaceae bacterium]